MAEPAIAARSLADRLASFRQPRRTAAGRCARTGWSCWPAGSAPAPSSSRTAGPWWWSGSCHCPTPCDGRWRSARSRPTSTPRRPACRPAPARSSSWPAWHGCATTCWSCGSTCCPTTRSSDRCCARWSPTWPRPSAWSATTGAPSTCRCWPRASPFTACSARRPPSPRPTTTCCPRRGGCSGGRSAEPAWRTSRRACWASGERSTARAARCRPAISATWAAARRTSWPWCSTTTSRTSSASPCWKGSWRGCAPAAGATRRCSIRAGWRSTCCVTAPSRGAGAGRVGPGDHRRSGGSERAATGRLPPAAGNR